MPSFSQAQLDAVMRALPTNALIGGRIPFESLAQAMRDLDLLPGNRPPSATPATATAATAAAASIDLADLPELPELPALPRRNAANDPSAGVGV